MKHRVFTPAEANQTLPLVKRIVGDILGLADKLREVARAPLSTVEQVDRAHELQEELNDLMQELREFGCDYKDWGFEMGLVDYPSFLDGQPVLLCWRSDEPAVEWYHAPDAGYAGRQRIPVELLGTAQAES